MKSIAEIYPSIVSNQQAASLGFENLNNFFPGTGQEISIFFLSSSILSAVLKHINVKPVKSLTDLGKENSFVVLDECEWKKINQGSRLDLANLFKEVLEKNYLNKVSSTILILDSKSTNLDNFSMEAARISSFIAEIISPELEMIILKNRYSNRGKVQLNLENKGVLDVLQFKTQKHNVIVGQHSGLKTTVMHSIIKNKLDAGETVCYVSQPQDARSLLLNLLGLKRNADFTPELVTKIQSLYGTQLLFNPADLDEVPEDVILFIDSEEYNVGSKPQVKSKEIWSTFSQRKNGGVNFDAIEKSLFLKDNEKVSYLKVIVNNESKVILETMSSGKGFWLDQNHRISADLFVNMNNYESCLFLDKQVQELTKKINNETNLNNLDHLTQQRSLLLCKLEEKMQKNSSIIAK